MNLLVSGTSKNDLKEPCFVNVFVKPKDIGFNTLVFYGFDDDNKKVKPCSQVCKIPSVNLPLDFLTSGCDDFFDTSKPLGVTLTLTEKYLDNLLKESGKKFGRGDVWFPGFRAAKKGMLL